MSLTTELTPGHRRDTTATITLEGGHEIFRFAVNMLFQQVEFAAAGRTLLVELREHLTPERFDPMARSLLGEHRYGKLRDRFERDRFCTACETKIKAGDKYGRIENAAAVCKPCVDELDPLTVELFEMAEATPMSTRYWRRLDVKAEPYVIEVDGDVRSERDALVAASLGLAREKSELEKELTGVRDQLAAAVRRSEQDRTNAGALQLRYDEMRRERDDLLARLSQAFGWDISMPGERP